MTAKLLVGVGNPGEEYTYNRHNVGFQVMDYIAEKMRIKFKYDKRKCNFGKKKMNNIEVIILKPQTFVNLSGEAVLYLASFLKVDIRDVLVVFDDLNKKFGSLEMPPNSKHIVHSAILHIEKSLNNDTFSRLSFGIGPLPKKKLVEDFYLENFTPEEKKKIPDLFEKARQICHHFLFSD